MGKLASVTAKNIFFALARPVEATAALYRTASQETKWSTSVAVDVNTEQQRHDRLVSCVFRAGRRSVAHYIFFTTRFPLWRWPLVPRDGRSDDRQPGFWRFEKRRGGTM